MSNPNWKGQLINKFAGTLVKFKSTMVGGPSNAPVWQSNLYINDESVFVHRHCGSKVDSEQILAKLYLDSLDSLESLEESKEEQFATQEQYQELRRRIEMLEKAILTTLESMNLQTHSICCLSNRVATLETEK